MGDKDFKLDLVKIKAGIDIAMTLIESGTKMYQAIKQKNDITAQELLDLIDQVNEEQELAKARLRALIEQKKNEDE